MPNYSESFEKGVEKYLILPFTRILMCSIYNLNLMDFYLI